MLCQMYAGVDSSCVLLHTLPVEGGPRGPTKLQVWQTEDLESDNLLPPEWGVEF